MAGAILSQSSFTAIIDAPFEKIDIPAWLYALPTAEYKRCSPDHIACGATFADDGTRMSINVERIGGALLVQNYVEHHADPHDLKLVSITDVFGPQGRSTSEVTWELSARQLEDGRVEYRNSVTARATDAFDAFIKEHGIAFEEAAAARQKASSVHNQGETPLFAKSIERAALAKR
ncbi:hypothetical protein KHC28_24810 [Ancylobacter sonchi]|uniref:hypothetical protein n=1 Tax=Ancylobacter sonchi TaxID=1937790 RepID=UPI001BD5E938|nr:hypothetical protein [Ancylobacter sonchi]MBS7536869.1 hypothetical protein [Ancylobacter sonchi]